MDKPRELVVMSWSGIWGWALRKAACGPFSEQTGIAVRQVHHVGLQLPPALCDALAQGAQPPFHAVWCNAVPALWAEAAGFCEPLDDLVGLEGLSPRAHPRGVPGRPIVFPYVVYYVLVYRSGMLPREPASWSALLEGRHRGRVALYPRGHGILPIAQVMGDGRLVDIPNAMAACWRFVRALGPQVAELDYSLGMERRLADGRLSLCFRALPNALAFRAAGIDVAFCVPEEGTSDTVDALWVPRGLPAAQRFWAKQLIAFSLQPSVQQALCELLGCMPVHPGARPPALITTHPRLPKAPEDTAAVLHVPEEIKLAHDADWADRFERELALGRAAARRSW